MQHVSDLANDYEQWANESEKLAESILRNLRSADGELQSNKWTRVIVLQDEAYKLRQRAKQLRSSRAFLQSV